MTDFQSAGKSMTDETRSNSSLFSCDQEIKLESPGRDVKYDSSCQEGGMFDLPQLPARFPGRYNMYFTNYLGTKVDFFILLTFRNS